MAFTRKDFLQTSAMAALGSLPLTLSKENKPSSNTILHPTLKPRALKKGDTLGLVAPASPIYQDEVFDEMLNNLIALGFKLKLGKHVRDQRGYLAGTDQDRARDLMTMFQDPEVDGIMCIRGGWGCNRILPLLDYKLISQHPKVFCGFSDITSLHMAFMKKSGLHTFHGPVGKSVWNEFTVSAFDSVIMKGEKPVFRIPEDETDTFTLTPGKARGILLGGNLSVLVAMIGSDYLPSFEGAILYLEDVGESVYRIDRMITQLKLAGILDQISGLVFGKCTDCDAGDNSLTLKQVMEDHVMPLEIPMYYGAMISHEDDNITLPVGIQAEIDASEKVLRILDTGVI